MVSVGDLIGIAYGEVYFVGDAAIIDNVCVVTAVDTYRPVGVDMCETLRDEDRVIEEDVELKEFWKEAVASDRTEDGFEDWARSCFREEQEHAEAEGNLLWFFNQSIGGSGMRLCQEEKLHKMVSADMKDITGKEVGSWEESCWMSPEAQRRKDGEPMKPIKWDVIYNWDAAEACENFVNLYPKYSFNEWLKKLEDYRKGNS